MDGFFKLREELAVVERASEDSKKEKMEIELYRQKQAELFLAERRFRKAAKAAAPAPARLHSS